MNRIETLARIIKTIDHEEWELHRFFQFSPDIFLIADPLCILMVNQAYIDKLGWTAAESKGVEWNSFIHPDDLELSHGIIKRLEDHNVELFVVRYMKKDGTYTPITWSATQWENDRTYMIGRTVN